MSLKIKVQQCKRNVFVNLPIDIQGHLELVKGDTIKFVIRDSGVVEIRKEEN